MLGAIISASLISRTLVIVPTYNEADNIFIDRRVGASKMSTRIVLEAVVRSWQLRYLRLRSVLSLQSTKL